MVNHYLPRLVVIGIVLVEICFLRLMRKIPNTLASTPHYFLSLKNMA